MLLTHRTHWWAVSSTEWSRWWEEGKHWAIKLMLAGLFWLIIVALCLLLVELASVPAYGHDDEPTEMDVLAGVRQLHPKMQPAVAAAWAAVFYEAYKAHGIDPLLIAAIAYRESNFREDVVGNSNAPASKQDIGAMQLRGLARTYMPAGCDPRNMQCNVFGGAAFLEALRAQCGEPWEVWVAAYGTTHCPTLDEIASNSKLKRSVRRAKEFYVKAGGTHWGE